MNPGTRERRENIALAVLAAACIALIFVLKGAA